jgi:hypothetical protein
VLYPLSYGGQAGRTSLGLGVGRRAMYQDWFHGNRTLKWALACDTPRYRALARRERCISLALLDEASHQASSR